MSAFILKKELQYIKSLTSGEVAEVGTKQGELGKKIMCKDNNSILQALQTKRGQNFQKLELTAHWSFGRKR